MKKRAGTKWYEWMQDLKIFAALILFGVTLILSSVLLMAVLSQVTGV
jgi:hypothetical protein